VTPVPPHDIVRAVRTELATPGRYHLHAAVANAGHSWLWYLFHWVSDAFARFLNALASRMHLGRQGAATIGDLLVFGSMLLVAFVAARLMLSMQLERSAYGARDLSPARSAQALSRAASEAAAAGNYGQAIRLLFAAAVVMLDLRGVVHDDESATVNELRRALRARGGAVEAPFAAIARTYTDAAYAERAIDEGAWQRARDAYAQLAEAAT
jgi:Domain of unknown function (DUF4129)